MNTATPSNHFKLTVSKASKPVLGPGRRETLTNRDLGTVEATAGRMLALVTSATQGMGPASGWLPCLRAPLIYVLKGWVDLAEDGTHTRIETGDSVIIPGGMRHNVSGTANEIEVLTITVSAEAEMVTCDRPSGLSPLPPRQINPVGWRANSADEHWTKSVFVRTSLGLRELIPRMVDAKRGPFARHGPLDRAGVGGGSRLRLEEGAGLGDLVVPLARQ